jgi:mannosyltransferase OCH1-like enzyme
MLDIKLKQQEKVKQQVKQQIKDNIEKIKKIKEDNECFKNYNSLNIKIIPKKSYNSIIPLNLYTCWHTKELPPYLNSIYEEVKKTNPEFNHFLYDENMCAEFIKNNFDESVLNAYNSLIPNSYKSDLWRFCVLYINGGIYYDIKFSCKNNFKFIYLTEKEEFIRDRPINLIYTALIVSKPKNEIMKKCIDQIVCNVNNKFYGVDPLYPKGPGLLGSFFTLDEYNNIPNYFAATKINESFHHQYIVYNNTIILSSDDIIYRQCQLKNQIKPHYHVLWHEGKIYQ